MLVKSGSIYLFAGLFLAMMSISGCPRTQAVHTGGPAPTTQSLQAHLGPGRVYDPQERFSIVMPPGYRNDGQSQWHFMKFLGPVEKSFTVNVNIRAQDDDGTPIERAAPKVKGLLPVLLRNYHVVEEGFSTVGSRKVYYASGTFEWDGQQVRNLQYFIRGGNGRVYVISFASPKATFARHRLVFEQTVKSVLIQ